MKSYQTLVEAAKTLAIEAARLVSSSQKRDFSMTSKSSINDIVTDVDKAAEAFLIERISTLFPDDSIVAEEGGTRSGTSGIYWVLDPIDGTTNFIYDFPSYSVSIGVKEGDNTVAGAVFNIAEDTLYWAGTGLGSFKDQERIHVRERVPIENSLIGTGFGYTAARRTAQAKYLSTLIGDVRDIRRAGAASLDLCYVAEGRLDGYYESGLWPWDYAAASLIVREAGGIVLGPTSDLPTAELTVAASNLELATFLKDRLLPFLPFADG